MQKANPRIKKKTVEEMAKMPNHQLFTLKNLKLEYHLE